MTDIVRRKLEKVFQANDRNKRVKALETDLQVAGDRRDWDRCNELELFIALAKCSYLDDICCFLEDNDISKKRFTKIIPFCASDAKEQSKLLVARLVYGLNLLGGLQQPGHSESEAEAAQEQSSFEFGNEKLKDVVLDIITALGFTPDDLK